jgi:hypothetical protein
MVGPPAVNPNCGVLLERIRAQLALHHSSLVVESATITCVGFAISTVSVASDGDLVRVREGVRLALPECSHVNTALPLSTSFLKLSDVPFLKPSGQGFATVTSEDVMGQIARAGLSSLVVLSAPARVVQDSPKSDTCTVYLNVADLVSGARAKALVKHKVQFRQYVDDAQPGKPNKNT